MSSDEEGKDFLGGGGEMGTLTRAFNWASTSLGPPESWPQSLRLTVRIMLNSGHPMFIWWGPDLIQFYNDAYRRTMGTERHPSALGQKGAECWAEIWPTIGPMIDYVMAGKGTTWDEDRLVPVTRHGARQDVWWTFSYVPIDLDDRVGGVLVVCNDVTDEHLAREALKQRTRNLEYLFQETPTFIAVLRGPEHVFDMTNAAYNRLAGNRDYVGKRVREVVPEVEGQGYFELLDEVYRSGKAHIGQRTPLKIRRDPHAAPEELYVDFIYQPIIEDKAVSGILVVGSDVTSHVRAERHLQVMNEELKHRVKNTLSMVSSIATQTLRGRDFDLETRSFRDRLSAFGRAHDVLTATAWSSASLKDVVATALAPHGGTDERIVARGPHVELGPKQALSLTLALHELATNAAKYGALSSRVGTVNVDWTLHRAKDGTLTFSFTWQEAGGPQVAKPSKQGFGSRLIQRILAADFEGSVVMEYEVEGVICRLSTAASNLQQESPSPFFSPGLIG